MKPSERRFKEQQFSNRTLAYKSSPQDTLYNKVSKVQLMTIHQTNKSPTVNQRLLSPKEHYIPKITHISLHDREDKVAERQRLVQKQLIHLKAMTRQVEQKQKQFTQMKKCFLIQREKWNQEVFNHSVLQRKRKIVFDKQVKQPIIQCLNNFFIAKWSQNQKQNLLNRISSRIEETLNKIASFTVTKINKGRDYEETINHQILYAERIINLSTLNKKINEKSEQQIKMNELYEENTILLKQLQHQIMQKTNHINVLDKIIKEKEAIITKNNEKLHYNIHEFASKIQPHCPSKLCRDYLKLCFVHQTHQNQGIKNLRVNRIRVGQATTCSICIEDFKINEIATELGCSHCFHVGCIASWLEKSSNCPMCKANLKE